MGAQKIGEFSWAVENMLNRVVDGLVQPSPPVVELVGEACAAQPELVRELRGEGAASAKVSCSITSTPCWRRLVVSESDDASVRCMFLPLFENGLLVPSSGVAEIVGLSPPREIQTAPPWMVGYMSWRGIDIPLQSIESALGGEAAPGGVRNRVAVMRTLRDDLAPTFYGVVIQRLPTVVLASERNLETNATTEQSGWIQGAVDLEVGRGLIASFEHLEEQLHSL